MTREQIIAGLEDSVDFSAVEQSMTIVEQGVVRGALELLKAQEPKYPVYTALNGLFAGKNLSHWNCGACGAFLYNAEWFGSTLKDDRPKYCSRCGQAVKWE